MRTGQKLKVNYNTTPPRRQESRDKIRLSEKAEDTNVSHINSQEDEKFQAEVGFTDRNGAKHRKSGRNVSKINVGSSSENLHDRQGYDTTADLLVQTKPTKSAMRTKKISRIAVADQGNTRSMFDEKKPDA